MDNAETNLTNGANRNDEEFPDAISSERIPDAMREELSEEELRGLAGGAEARPPGYYTTYPSSMKKGEEYLFRAELEARQERAKEKWSKWE